MAPRPSHDDDGGGGHRAGARGDQSRDGDGRAKSDPSGRSGDRDRSSRKSRENWRWKLMDGSDRNGRNKRGNWTGMELRQILGQESPLELVKWPRKLAEELQLQLRWL